MTLLRTPSVKLDVALDHEALKSNVVGKVRAVCRVRVLAKAPQRQRHYVFVIDMSASMTEHQKWPTLVNTLENVLARLDTHALLSFIVFNHDATIHFSARSCADVSPVLQRLRTLKPTGTTNLSHVLLNHVPDVLTACDLKTDTHTLHTVLLLTDGRPTHGILNLKKLLRTLRTAYAPFAKRLVLSTFGYGIDHLPSWLYHLAASYNGIYAYIANTEAMTNAFDTLLKLVTRIAFWQRQVVFKAQPGTRIVRIQSYAEATENTVAKQYTVTLPMLRESETRHLLLTLSVNKQDTPNPNQHLLSVKVGQDTRNVSLPRTQTTVRTTPTLLVEQQQRFALLKIFRKVLSAVHHDKLPQAKHALTQARRALLPHATTSDFLYDLDRDLQLCLTLLVTSRKQRRFLAYMYGLFLMYCYERPVPTAWLHAHQATLEGLGGFVVPQHQTQRSSQYSYTLSPPSSPRYTPTL